MNPLQCGISKLKIQISLDKAPAWPNLQFTWHSYLSTSEEH
jgi:hypothetical protein